MKELKGVANFVGAFTALILGWLILRDRPFDARWLWGAFSYGYLADTGYSWLMRIVLYLMAAGISLFLLALVPRKQTFFSYIGQRTMPIFVLHGFVILLLKHHHVVSHIPPGFATAAFLVAHSLAIVWVFSTRWFTAEPYLRIRKAGDRKHAASGSADTYPASESAEASSSSSG
jgi:fucose 4-O-acetylase-like acetyltransferase